jgi:hypothetical protein
MSISITIAGVTYSVPSSAADTNWAADQVVFEQALASYLLTPPTWLAPSLTNSWVNAAGGTTAAGYYKDTSGRVWLRGVIKTGASLSSAFTLPSGYRPTAGSENFSAVTATGLGVVIIATSGTVTIADLVNSGCSTSTSLSGISFTVA